MTLSREGTEKWIWNELVCTAESVVGLHWWFELILLTDMC